MKAFVLLTLPIFVSWSTPCQYRKSNSLYSLSHTDIIQFVSLGELSTQLTLFSKLKLKGFIELHLSMCFLTSPRILFSLWEQHSDSHRPKNDGLNSEFYFYISMFIDLYNGVQ